MVRQRRAGPDKSSIGFLARRRRISKQFRIIQRSRTDQRIGKIHRMSISGLKRKRRGPHAARTEHTKKSNHPEIKKEIAKRKKEFPIF
jgi:hypothetical protein